MITSDIGRKVIIIDRNNNERFKICERKSLRGDRKVIKERLGWQRKMVNIDGLRKI